MRGAVEAETGDAGMEATRGVVPFRMFATWMTDESGPLFCRWIDDVLLVPADGEERPD